ncbi:MAG: DUF1285 domain-containing protein [Halieaceae bacterium]|nr:DUF1285 domain-containing protein [Halieaceae bacterium]MCP5203212.1 DUF1285 domain-containing protein [Pseudomonadales bacterium]
MARSLDDIAKQAGGRNRNFTSPPLHLWHPDLSGDIAIRIAADGRWYHEGSAITRQALVNLFASILRREEDGHYYLVTPAEKWRIQVDLHPLVVTDIDVVPGSPPQLQASLNTGRQVMVDALHPLAAETSMQGVPYLALEHGLTALFSRNAWYRLADIAEPRDGVPVVRSGDYCFELAGD